MELQKWPSDILRLVLSELPVPDVFRLKQSGSKILWSRIEKESLLHSMVIRSSRLPFHNISTLTNGLIHLKITMESRSIYLAQVDFEIDPYTLPKTLETLDFAFRTCQTMWLRKVTPGQLNWSLVSPSNGLAPIFLKELLPKLRKLRLNGSWLADRTWNGYKGGSWREPMIWLFLMQLPSTLESLDINLDLPGQPKLIPYLPPNLTSLRVNEGTKMSIENRAPHTLPPDCMASLRSYDWRMDSNISTHLLRFSQLQSLNLTSISLKNSDLRHLPRKLTSLSFNFSTRGPFPGPTFDYEDLAQLPSGLLALTMVGCCPPLEPEDIDLGQSRSELVEFLPRNLTSLSLLSLVKTWILDVDLAGLSASLTSLRELVIEAGDSADIACRSLQWVPCATLRSLKLQLVSSSENTLSDSTFRTWPDDMPNNIIEMTIKGGNLSHRIAVNLPPRLTSLHLEAQLTLRARDFLALCPRTLVSLTVKPTTGLPLWTDLEVLESCFPRHLQIRSPFLFTGKLLPAGTLEFSDQGGEHFDKFWIPPILRYSQAVIRENMLQHLPESITRIACPLIITSNSPIWNLPNLQSLHVQGISREALSKETCTSLGVLKTLHLDDHCDPRWFMTPRLSTITDLTIQILTEVSLANLKNLTRFRLINIPHTAFNQTLWNSLPGSVTSLSVHKLPQEFWQAQICQIASSTSSTSEGTTKSSPEIKWKLKFLDYGRTYPLTQKQLASLFPHLEELHGYLLEIEDLQTVYSGFKRDLAEIRYLELIQSICPSVSKLNRPDSIHLALSLPPDILSTGNAASCETILALPRSLTIYEARRWNDLWAPHLPPSLTKLEITATLKSAPFLPPSLSSLVELSIVNIKSQKPWSVDFYQGLPRTLTCLSIDSLTSMTKAMIQALPPRLKQLTAPKLLLSQHIDCLPHTLTKLEVATIRPQAVVLLPKSITELKWTSCVIANEWDSLLETWEEALPNLLSCGVSPIPSSYPLKKMDALQSP